LIRWVEESLRNARTCEGVSVKIISYRDNCITVKINKVEKIIIILPLGLPDELPKNIQSHSVEDYILVELFSKGVDERVGDSSKKILNEMKERMSIQKQKQLVQSSMRSSINKLEKLISQYIEPPWKF
jgi:hypothetical protein